MVNWDYMITYGGPELFMVFVIIIVTPFVYWLILKHFKLVTKIISILSIWITAVFIAYWDVYQIAKEAERLCREEAGLHVYKTVEAEGFVGVTDVEYWSEYGFKYVEHNSLGKKTRFTLKNGEVIEEKINMLKSRYEYKTDLEVLEMPFNRGKKIIKDRQSGDVLGEIISFAVYPGWLDSRLLGVMGFSWSPAGCDGDYPPEPQKATLYIDDLVRAVIKPKNSEKGEQK